MQSSDAIRPPQTPDPIRNPNSLPSVLTSDIHNEAELIFSILENKDRKTVSYLDVLTLLRGMGMNPLMSDMHYLRDVMAEPIERLSAAYREEEARKEKERKKEEEKESMKKPKVNKQVVKGKANGKDSKETTDKDFSKKKPLSEPQEEIKNIDWNIFISAVEPFFRDNDQEITQILTALRILDTEGKGRMRRSDLIDIITQEGESVLSPSEIQMLITLIPEEFSFMEFAQRVQGTYIPPTQAEIEAAEELRRREREIEMAAAAAAVDPLADLLGDNNNNNNNNNTGDVAGTPSPQSVQSPRGAEEETA
eukprot:Tbor_TRINITY_DN5305_c1_g2::TRINITY_DN5305_c1_g2_i8::g.4857::m.4857